MGRLWLLQGYFSSCWNGVAIKTNTMNASPQRQDGSLVRYKPYETARETPMAILTAGKYRILYSPFITSDSMHSTNPTGTIKPSINAPDTMTPPFIPSSSDLFPCSSVEIQCTTDK